jgi:hypothetical protein
MNDHMDDDDYPDHGAEMDGRAAMGLPSPVTDTMTDPGKLPQWNGRPVPWATKWTGEESTDPFTILPTADGPMVTYPSGPVNRDEWGYLWRREGIGRRGEPQWKQLSAHRQKVSMRAPRCHVCGVKLPPGPIRWLLPKKAVSIGEGAVVANTISPPTCDGCIPLARWLCPHLGRHGADLLLVKRWEVWGVIGEVFVLDGYDVESRIKDVMLQYGRTYKDVGTHNFVARQQVMGLLDFEVLEE